MYLWVVRHAIAIDRADPECPSDPDRELTAKGRSRMERAAAGLRRLDVVPERIVASPYVRAFQTAEVLAQAMLIPEVEITPALEPDQDPMVILAELGKTAPVNTIICGHAPHVDRLVARVCGAPSPFTHLKKGSVAAIEMPDGVEGPGTLRWLMTPRQLRARADR